jgi:hypothetical protein
LLLLALLKGDNMSRSSYIKKSLWIKKPLSVFTANQSNADNGIVIRDGIIIELVARAMNPTVILTKYSMLAAMWLFLD